ncbi:hypothetical protein Taro_035180 [Colocasia esculenta]|uniref:AB hydrolase-1 domain-containing protein n=1 Tax=Colocasia esculenta TaxID=4460 RepID=A0A843WE48_COLES|nr:hypothetical protein [Colocasia esculenta]
MGNSLTCMPKKDLRGVFGSASKRFSRSSRMSAEEELLHRQALAMMMQQHQISQRFDGSMSRRIGSMNSRRRALSESFSNGKQIADFIENIETKKFVLVHGEGFGAWCWYKCISLLEEAGLHPIALDLTGSGIDHRDTDSITTMAEYTKPLLDFLQNLPEDEKVILVGHSCGGASISYALECYPKKISKAVFVTATMVTNGKRPFDVFAEEVETKLTSLSGEYSAMDIFLHETHRHPLYTNE